MSRRFLRRIGDGGGQLAVIDPGTLPNLEIYLSGLNGITPLTNLASLTSWKDQSGNARDFGVIPGGAVAPVVLKDFIRPGVSAISISSGGSPRVISNNALPSFTQSRGSTIYAMANLNTGNGNGLRYGFWPNGAASGPSLIYQAAGFSFFPGVPNGNVAVQLGAFLTGGLDTGVATPNQTWDLWTFTVDPGPGALHIYHNGALISTQGTAVSYLLQTECDLGGPSTGNAQFGEMAAYLLYTATHTPGQIAAVYAWFKAFYGI